MKRLSYILTVFLASLGLALTACTDELNYPDNGTPEELYDGIVLSVPDAATISEGITRSETSLDDDAIALAKEEGKLTELYLIAFPENAEYDPIVANILKDGDVIQVHTNAATHVGFTTYDVTELFKKDNKVMAGNWAVYVAANLSSYLDLDLKGKSLEDYLKGITDDNRQEAIKKKKEALQALKLNFYDNDGSYRLSISNIKSKGLPMVCKPSEMRYRIERMDNQTEATGGLVEIKANGKGELHADLTFLCAKVRYTLLFDNTTNVDPEKNGFSYKMFPDMSFVLDAVGAKNLPHQGTTVDGPVAPTTKKDCSGFLVKEYKYPTAGYPSSVNDNLTKFEQGEEPSFNQRAFQGVIYLPENTVTNGGTDASVFTFTAHTTYDKKVSESETERTSGTTLGYTMSLLPDIVEYASNDKTKAIKRGHSYDIVAEVQGVETLKLQKIEVAPWTSKILSYTLRLPAYLKVAETSVPVTAGQTTEMWYESNAQIVCDAPIYDGKPLYIFDTKTANTIKIKVNPEINTSVFSTINASLDDYSYFHITAGTLHKKIDVSPLILQRFLTVDPRSFTIDAREKIAGGYYSSGDKDYYDVTIETNADQFYIEDLTWKETSPGTNLKIYKMVNDVETELTWSENNGKYTIKTGYKNGETATAGFKNGKMVLRIKYDDVNSGANFWKESHELNFRVYTDNVGANNATLEPGDEGYISPTTVKVSTRPNSDNYTIYFNAPDDWSSPHIYVYQCLELPAWVGTQTVYKNNDHTGGTTTLNLSNYPVGYQDNGNEFAVLEYSFTGAVIFKGWENSVNTITNSMLTDGYVMGGFFMFKGSTSDKCNWSPSSSDGSRYFKGENVDFYKDYRSHLDCDDCKDYSKNSSWPGIKMTKVKPDDSTDHWWKFELTGVATPGKALIMFNDTHSDVSRRYPGAAEVGVPLFGYPSRVGYFNYRDGKKTFSQSATSGGSGGNGGGGSGEEMEVTRIYFTNADSNGTGTGWNPPYIYVYGGDSGSNGSFPGNAMKKDSSTGYWYWDIPEGNNYAKVIFSNGKLGNNGGHQTNSFDIDKKKDLYNSEGVCGNASGGGNDDPINPSSSYTIYWPQVYMDSNDLYQIYVEYENGDKLTDFSNGNFKDGTWTGSGFKYTFTSNPASGKKMNVYIARGNNCQVAKNKITLSSFNTNNEYTFSTNDFAVGYRLYVKKMNDAHNAFNSWFTSGGSGVTAPKGLFTDSWWTGSLEKNNATYYYVDININGNFGLSWELVYNANWNNGNLEGTYGGSSKNDKGSVTQNSFNFDTTVKRKVYTINNYNSGTGSLPARRR